MKQAQPSVPTISQFLSRNASHKFSQTKTPFRVGIDSFVQSASFAQSLTHSFADEVTRRIHNHWRDRYGQTHNSSIRFGVPMLISYFTGIIFPPHEGVYFIIIFILFYSPLRGELDLCVNIYSPQIQIYKILRMSKNTY